MKKICFILLFGLGIFYNCENAYADWSPGSGVQGEALKNWVAKETEKYMNFTGVTLGGNVGDKVTKEITFPDNFYVEKHKGENNWNGQWYIYLGKNNFISGGYMSYDNFTFANSGDIRCSISGNPTDKKRALTVERLKTSKTTNYDIVINYTFASKGAMYNDYGLLTATYNTITPSGSGATKTIKLNAVPEQDKLTAEPVSQTTTLGSDITKLDYSKFVTNVKLGDQSLSPDHYTVSLINNFSTDTVGDEIAKVKVTSKSDTSKIIEVPIPVKVKWGNTIAISGIWVNSNNHRIVAALPYISDGKQVKLKLLPGRGAESLTLPSYPNSNSEYFSNVSFFKIDKDVNLINDDLAIQRFNLNSSNTPIEIQNSWNTSIGELTMNFGDVIGVWHISKTGEVKDRPWSYLIENEVFNDYTEYNNMTYYELTKNGYRPLHVNHLNVSNGSVPIYSNKQYMDTHVAEFIDLGIHDSVTIKGFVEYPDTTSSGDKRAKILVEETLTTGKKVQYEYEVTINVEPGTLTYTVPKTLTFKEFTKSKNEQIIERKYSGSLGLLIKDNRGSNSQGNWTLTAKASSDLKGIAPYLIYRNEKGVDSYLNGSAVPVYTQDKQVSATEPLEVEVSNKWKSTDGILLKVPSKNNLASQEYSTTITWNLVEGP